MGCGAELDASPLITEEFLNKEGKVIPEGKGSNYPDFIKLPNIIEGTKGEIEVGDQVTVITEFAPPNSPKLKSPLIGTVNLINGEDRTVGLNWTSYYDLAKVLGKDTKDWLGKEITYAGMKKCGKGALGHIWSAKI